MENISIKSLIDFRRKSERSKISFAESLITKRIKEYQEGGGDYWISSMSAISNSFKSGNLRPVLDKIESLRNKREETLFDRTRNMYQRNIEILYNYRDFDQSNWRPSKNITFLKKERNSAILTVKGLPLHVTPSHLFTFQSITDIEIGAIWFIPKLNGHSLEELGMHSEAMYRYLKKQYSQKYYVNSQYCIAVDIVNKKDVNYWQLEQKEFPYILNATIDELKKLI